jgi:hypothetical protein
MQAKSKTVDVNMNVNNDNIIKEEARLTPITGKNALVLTTHLDGGIIC